MAAQAKLIADAIVTIIQGVSGAPSLVEWRKTDVFFPNKPSGDPSTGVIVSGGPESWEGRVFEASVNKSYPWQISYYKPVAPPVPGDNTNPQFWQDMITALSVTTLIGTKVWDYEIATRSEWENQPFAQGIEVSRGGVLYRTNEAP